MIRRLVFSMLILVSGCAFTEVPINLPTSVGTGLSGGDDRQIFVRVPFADERGDKSRCGTQKNGYNMETARAVCSSEPANWFAGLLASELRGAGFSVITEEGSAKPTALRISGSMVQLFVEPVIGFTTVNLESDVQVRLMATSQSGLVAERSFFTKGTASGLAATQGNFQSSFDDASRRLVKEVVAAVLSLMNRYPELGFEGQGHVVIQVAV